ncbi:20071_t:CDS:2, partial [Gigaspora margarita]
MKKEKKFLSSSGRTVHTSREVISLAQMKLNFLTQQDHERVDTYTTKFKKLLNCVNTNNCLPDEYIVRMFLSSLKGMNTALVAVTVPKSLSEAIAAARKVEAGNYYRQYNSELEKQSKLRNEEMEHIAREYLFKKSVNNKFRKDRKQWNQNKQVNYCKIHLENSGQNNEMYNLGNEDKKVAKTQPILEEGEKSRIEVINNSVLNIENPINKVKRKQGPSVIDKLEPYNIANDILSMQTSAMATAARCYVRIQNNPILAVLDLETA